jgi:hypothetical protein
VRHAARQLPSWLIFDVKPQAPRIRTSGARQREVPCYSQRRPKRMNDAVYKITTYFGNVSAVALLVLAVALYLLPTIVGSIRKKRNLLNIAFFNVFLGWTVIAWAVMLIEAFKSDDAS